MAAVSLFTCFLVGFTILTYFATVHRGPNWHFYWWPSQWPLHQKEYAMKDPSRIYRWLLLVASLVTVGYLVGAAVHENYLAQWKTVQLISLL